VIRQTDAERTRGSSQKGHSRPKEGIPPPVVVRRPKGIT
jgi:hypothetical protein